MGKRFQECAAFDIDLHRSEFRFLRKRPIADKSPFPDGGFGDRKEPGKPQISCVLERMPVARRRPQDSSEGPYQKGWKRAKKTPARGHCFCPDFRAFLAYFEGQQEGLGMDSRVSLAFALAGALCCGFAAGPAWATPLPRYGMFVFSSLCRDRMTDDLNGDRLVLVHLPFHDFGYMEGGDGGFTSTLLENLHVERGAITFSYRDEGEADKSKSVKNVRSTISAESVGLINWNGKPFRMMRQWKISGQIPACPEK